MSSCGELFQTIKIGNIELENRIIHGPATTNFGGLNGEIIPLTLEYYRTRAQGGPGLVITEAAFVSQESKAWPRQIGVDRDELIPGLKQLSDAIHEAGPKVFLQLCHAGRKASSQISGKPPVCASPVALTGGEVPREMTEEDIWRTIDDFGAAAKRAKEAGFDGVDIHSGHGNLPISFYSPLINSRKDGWNGGLPQRARFLLEVVRKIKEAAATDFPISVKISAEEFVDDGFHLDEAKELVKMLVDAGADAICAYGGPAGNVSHRDVDRSYEFAGTLPLGVKDGPLVFLAEAIKRITDVPVMTVGRVNDPAFAAAVIREGRADLVQVSRGFIADAQWANKVKADNLDLIRPCIACGNGCFSNIKLGVGITCTVNPGVGQEYLGFEKAPKAKKVLIIGGGAAGLEAAITAARRGHAVTVAEATDKVGGQLHLAASAPGRERIGYFAVYLEKEARRLGVEIKTGTKINMNAVKSMGVDDIIVATGALPISIPPFEVDEGVKIYNSWDILAGEEPDIKTLVVIGGGIVGCEAADYLAEKGYRVAVVEMLKDLLIDDFYNLMPDEKIVMKAKLDHYGVVSYVSSKVQKVTNNSVKILKDAVPMEIPADAIVMAIGSRPVLPEGAEAANNSFKVSYAGDCVKVRRIHDAIEEGYRAGMSI